MSGCLGGCAGGCKGKIAPPAAISKFLVPVGNIRQIVERDGLVLVAFQQFVIEIGIVIHRFDQIVAVEIIDRHDRGFLRLHRDNRTGGLAARGFDIDDFARVGADDGHAVQIVEPLPGGWANAFCAPFFLGHVILMRLWLGQSRHPLSQWARPVKHEAGKIRPGKGMRRIVASDGAAIELLLRRSDQARRVSLRVSALDGRVTLTLPRRMHEADALAFAQSRAEWIRTALGRVGTPRQVGPGARLPFAGTAVTIDPAPGRGAIRLEGDRLVVPGPDGAMARRVAVWLRFCAQERLAEACDRHEAVLGRRRTRLVLRDTRSRWGSCSSAGVLMFNWRLVMAPPEVLDYVAAHEVAHLAEMNHSARYWAIVERIFPDYRRARAWLRQEGNALHLWRFDAKDG